MAIRIPSRKENVQFKHRGTQETIFSTLSYKGEIHRWTIRNETDLFTDQDTTSTVDLKPSTHFMSYKLLKPQVKPSTKRNQWLPRKHAINSENSLCPFVRLSLHQLNCASYKFSSP